MNARHKSEALHKLESLSAIILDHILKVVLYPHHDAVRHWQAELDAFASKLQKFNAGKSGKPNFSEALIMEYIYSDRIVDIGLEWIETYGPTEKPLDMNEVKASVRAFSAKILVKTEI